MIATYLFHERTPYLTSVDVVAKVSREHAEQTSAIVERLVAEARIDGANDLVDQRLGRRHVDDDVFVALAQHFLDAVVGNERLARRRGGDDKRRVP